MIPVAFFNNKGGVGKTALVSHLSWMFALRGVPVLAVDLDPQANLSATLLSEERLDQLWRQEQTILPAVQPVMARGGDISPVYAEPVTTGLHLLVGDLGLSRFEDPLAESWGRGLSGEVGALRVISAFHRVIREAAERVGAALVLIDLAPNLGPLNRAALLAADRLVLPLVPHGSSLLAMETLGPTLRDWRESWTRRVDERPADSLDLPAGRMEATGYVLMSFGARDSRALRAGQGWVEQIPATFRRAVLGQEAPSAPPLERDPFCLAALKHYVSLMPLAMTARKPMFLLKAADGARGAHLDAVAACYQDFQRLAGTLADRVGVALP